MSGMIELPELCDPTQNRDDELSTDNWRPVTGVIHKTCGQTAYLHPYTNSLWGCPRCVMTYSGPDPEAHFAIDPQVLAAVTS